jgi:plastocyanin
MLAVFGIVVVGCGRGNDPSSADRQASGEVSRSSEAADVGTVHTVKMIGDSKGFYFEPETLTIEPGDKVVWKMVSGPPHNVSFRGQSTPEGAESILRENNRYVSEYYTVAGQTFEIHFTEEYPTGRYDYVCEPHVTSGMTGTLTIEPE